MIQKTHQKKSESQSPRQKLFPLLTKVCFILRLSVKTNLDGKTNLQIGMIIEGILVLKERNGSSRQALKKYILEKYPVGDTFDSRFNLAIRKGIDSGEFAQPKGPSGPVKVVKAKLATKADEEKVEAKKKVQTSQTKDEKLNGKSNLSKRAKAEEVEKKEPKKKVIKKKDPSKSIKETQAASSKKIAKKTVAKSAKKDTRISNRKRAVKVDK